jgi:outer membrane protein OmpA-like peptidoglycan-associated protein
VNRKLLVALIALSIGLGLFGERAEAQSFRLNRFRGAERPDDGFGVRRMLEVGHLRFGALLTGDYAHDPLVIERERDGERKELQKVVEHQLTLKIDLSLGLWNRLIVFAGLEALPLLRGPDVPPQIAVAEADGAGLGDLSLGGRVRLVGEADDLFALGVQAALIAPTAGTQRYRGEEGVAVRPELIAELRPRALRISLNLGALVRRQQRLLAAQVASDLVYGLAIGVPVHERFELLGELSGGFGLKDFGRRATTDSEWLLGGKFSSVRGVYLAAAAGTGFTHAVGSPDARVIAQLGYLSPLPKKQEAPESVPATPTDRDGDGISDADDICPDAAEDADGFEDGDGCPEPGPDSDRDGVLDVTDRCPEQPEDRDQFEDEDGCPDPDNDGDGVLDVSDACPSEKGVAEERGCPRKGAQFTEEGELIVLEQILFESNQAVIAPQSYPILEAVKATLSARSESATLRIEGHTDTTGAEGKNMKLSEERAEAVGRWLVQHDVAKARLAIYGCGERHPVASDETEAGRAQNRRVVFQLIEPSGEGNRRLNAPAGCRPVKLD